MFIILLILSAAIVQGTNVNTTNITTEKTEQKAFNNTTNITTEKTEQKAVNNTTNITTEQKAVNNTTNITTEKTEQKAVNNTTNITTEKTEKKDAVQELIDTLAMLQLELRRSLNEIRKREMDTAKRREMYYQKRTAQVSSLKNQSQEEHPYPHKFRVTISLEEAVDLCMSLDEGEFMNNTILYMVGRIHHVKTNGTQITSYDLKADNGIIQVTVNHNISDQQIFKGDIIGVNGHPGKSKSGELIVTSNNLKLLSPCLREITLPSELSNISKYKKRHLDLLLNDETKKIFRVKAKTVAYLRAFLDNMGFLEVETPILQPIAGGALVKPFKTHHDNTNQDLFLRVSPKVYHKQLIIGGIDRIYEIGRQFRNKKIDYLHNSEHTTLEFHMAYANYNDLIDMTENLIVGITNQMKGSNEFLFHHNSMISWKIIAGFTPPFRKISVIPALEKLMYVKFPPADQLHTPESNEFLKDLCSRYYYAEECKGPKTSSYILKGLIDILIRRDIKYPTFVVDYPQIISPFAKEHKEYPGIAEKFELYAYERLILSGYTEQSDPEKQRKQFELQDLFKSQGDEHVSPTDEDYITALEYGMPPSAGMTLDIEHLTMYLADVYSMKDVILFPETTDV